MLRNLGDLVRRQPSPHGDRVALTRETASGGSSYTYNELTDQVLACAAGFRKLGVKAGDRVGIFSDNSARWLITDLACMKLGAVDVPRGADTLPEEMEYILNHSGCSILLIQAKSFVDAAISMRARLPELRHIIVMERGAKSDPQNDIFSLDQILEQGEPEKDEMEAKTIATADDLATIVYTSGTTGQPKGVMLTHGNILHNIRTLPGSITVTDSDSLLSVLPSWHMLERTVEYCLLSTGAKLTYTDKRRFKKDLEGQQPTILVAVPRLWELVHGSIIDAIQKEGKITRTVAGLSLWVGTQFRTAQRDLFGNRLELKTPNWSLRATRKTIAAAKLALLSPAQFLGELILFRKIRRITGGRLNKAVSGGGALSEHIEEFFHTIGVPLLNGYGLTETSPIISVRTPKKNVPGTIGIPLVQTDVKVLGSSGELLGPGEEGVLYIKGPQVMRGYYKMEEETNKVLSQDGWFDTGDLGCIAAGGHLVFTGRSKDTIVLSSGENIQPSPIEKTLSQSPFIEHAIVVGQDRRQLGVLLEPNIQAVKRWAKEHALPEKSDRELLISKDVGDLLQEELTRLSSRKNGFRSFELIRSFRLLPEPLSIEGGTLTATLKVKKPVVLKIYKDLIETMYRK